jgi:hypothetical protein
MMFIATMTASLVTNSGRSAWFVGVLVLMVYLIFALTLYLLPPRADTDAGSQAAASFRSSVLSASILPAPITTAESG